MVICLQGFWNFKIAVLRGERNFGYVVAYAVLPESGVYVVSLVAGQRPYMIGHIFRENCRQLRIGLESQIINFSVVRIGHWFKKLFPFFNLHEWGFLCCTFSIGRFHMGLRKRHGLVWFLRWGNNRFLGKSKKIRLKGLDFLRLHSFFSCGFVLSTLLSNSTYAAFSRILAIMVPSNSSGK